MNTVKEVVTMALTDMVPWRKRKGSIPVKREFDDVVSPFRQEMNNLMESFFGGWDLDPFRGFESAAGDFMPSVDVKEDDRQIKITVELPGMDEEDIDVTLSGDSVTIRGEKNEETEDKGKGYYRSERRYGSFHRVIPLTSEIDEDKVEAKFKKGVLSLKLPRTEEAARRSKKIQIKGG